MFIHPALSAFSPDPDAINARLRARLTIWELFALLFCLSMVGFFVWVHARLSVIPFDYNVYVDATRGSLAHYYYADWLLPLFWPLARLPFTLGFVLWDILLILSVFFASRVFGGHTALALLTFQMFYVLFLGQIVPLLIAGLALLWWGIANRRWHLAGLGLALAAAKFQLGLTFGLLLWLFSGITWRERLRILLVPAIVVALSLLLDPSWPFALLARMQAIPPYDWGSISLWRWLGPFALLILIPPLFLPLTRPRRFLALAAAFTLALPYFQQTDLLALFVLPIGALPVLLGNLGFLFFKYQFDALQYLGLVPLLVYLSILLSALSRFLHPRNQPHPPD